MIIYSNKNIKILDVTVNDNSYWYRVIKGDHNITLYYSLAEHVEIPVGSFCVYQGERYTLERPEAFKIKHSRNFEYTVTLESYQAKAKIWKFRNPADGRLKFPLTAKPREHLQMFVDNMNARDGGWTAGDCVEGAETMIAYNHDYCIDALKRMAETFNTEYEFDGRRVSLRKAEYDKENPLALSYGRGNGFRSGIGRSDSDETPVEILYVQGGRPQHRPLEVRQRGASAAQGAGDRLRRDAFRERGGLQFRDRTPLRRLRWRAFHPLRRQASRVAGGGQPGLHGDLPETCRHGLGRGDRGAENGGRRYADGIRHYRRGYSRHPELRRLPH